MSHIILGICNPQITKKKQYGKGFRNYCMPEWEGEGRNMLNLQLRDFSLCSPWKVAVLLYVACGGSHFFLYPHYITTFFLKSMSYILGILTSKPVLNDLTSAK